MMQRNIKILIAEPSVIVRSGLAATLKRISHFHIQVSETASFDLVSGFLKTQKPDLLIMNPVYWGVPDLKKLRTETNCTDLSCFALLTAQISETLVAQYKDVIFLHDTIETIGKKIEKIFENPSQSETSSGSDMLSAREKEVLICVVKGMTNKEIGSELFLSTHTVISHRRNLTRKLEIHSTSGLTVYAIMNKLVSLEEISNVKAVE